MSLVVKRGVLGNLASYAVGARDIERVAIRSDDCTKRIVRLDTSVGEIGFRFEADQRLHDGDVLHADGRRVIAISVLPDDVLVFRPATLGAAIDLAHALGNRHLPIQRDGDAIVVRYDSLLEALGETHGVPVTRESRRVARPFAYAQAPHRHD